MADGQGFAQKLEAALESKRGQLDRVELPRLKESWKLFQVAFHGIGSVLLKKGIIHEDPYRYDLKISEVTNPPEGSYAESERTDQMSLRISQFEAYVEFLNNYYQFDSDFLTLGRIKRLLGLVKYFNFLQLSDTSTQQTTKGLAELVNMVRKGSDQMSSGIIVEAVGQLEKATRDILAILKALSEFHRENYKLEIRDLVMPGLTFDPAFAIGHKDEAIRKVKLKFAEVVADRPFYPELVEEILAEDYAGNAENLREELLRKLAVTEAKKTAKTTAKSYKAVVLEGIRILAGAHSQVEAAFSKLGENSVVLESQNRGFISQLKRMIRRMFSPESPAIKYEIDIVDLVSGVRKSETIDFSAFLEEGMKKGRALASFLQRGSPTMKRLEGAPDDLAFKFLERNIEELQRIIRRMNAMDDYFKANFAAEDRTRFKGIKSEITTIKNCLIKANQKKFEYHSQMEEEEQLRRLGVSSE